MNPSNFPRRKNAKRKVALTNIEARIEALNQAEAARKKVEKILKDGEKAAERAQSSFPTAAASTLIYKELSGLAKYYFDMGIEARAAKRAHNLNQVQILKQRITS